MPERLAQPATQKHAGRVFVCSMSDIGHEGVTDDMRGSIYAAMRDAPWHTYIVLTKRPGPWLRHVPVECWVGVSVETQTQVYRWNELFVWADVRSTKFVSVEPMLGPVTFPERARAENWCGCGECWSKDGGFPCPRPLRGLAWVIAGPETGAQARPFQDEWIDKLAAESPCFFDKRPIAGVRREWPDMKGPTA